MIEKLDEKKDDDDDQHSIYCFNQNCQTYYNEEMEAIFNTEH